MCVIVVWSASARSVRLCMCVVEYLSVCGLRDHTRCVCVCVCVCVSESSARRTRWEGASVSNGGGGA